jgi:hypothetical protein
VDLGCLVECDGALLRHLEDPDLGEGESTAGELPQLPGRGETSVQPYVRFGREPVEQ